MTSNTLNNSKTIEIKQLFEIRNGMNDIGRVDMAEVIRHILGDLGVIERSLDNAMADPFAWLSSQDMHHWFRLYSWEQDKLERDPNLLYLALVHVLKLRTSEIRRLPGMIEENRSNCLRDEAELLERALRLTYSALHNLLSDKYDVLGKIIEQIDGEIVRINSELPTLTRKVSKALADMRRANLEITSKVKIQACLKVIDEKDFSLFLLQGNEALRSLLNHK